MFTPGKKRSSESGQNTCFYTNEICMQGFLKKSPPKELFANQASWKNRYFMLVRILNKGYSLHYYAPKNKEHKGEICLKDVKSLCAGIEDRDRMSTVLTMFRWSPELVIFLKTEKREYYLLGENKDQVAEWFTAISKAWKAVRMDALPQTCSTIPSEGEEGRVRSPSCPVVSNSEPIEHKDQVQGGASRPYSDSALCSSSTMPRLPLPQQYHTKPVESKRLSEGSNSSDEGGVYDVPSPNLKCVFCANDTLGKLQCIHCPQQSNRKNLVPYLPEHEDSDCSEDDEDRNGVYEPMNLIRPSLAHTYVNIGYARTLSGSVAHPIDKCDGKTKNGTTGSPLSSPDLDERRMSKSSTQTEGDQTGGTLQRQSGSLERSGVRKKKRTPPLTHGRLLKLFSCRDQSQFMELDVSLPKEATSTCMGLLEVEDKICVSTWNGPEHLGYPFHVGDHILAVNDIGVESRDDVLKNISMARSEKVKITVLRVPTSAILNTELSRCSGVHTTDM